MDRVTHRNWPMVLFVLLLLVLPVLWSIAMRFSTGPGIGVFGIVYGVMIAVCSALFIVGGLWGRVWLQGIFIASLLGALFLGSLFSSESFIRFDANYVAICFALPAVITISAFPIQVMRFRYGWSLTRLPTQWTTQPVPFQLADIFLVTAALASIMFLGKFTATYQEWPAATVYMGLTAISVYGLVLSTVYLTPLLWFFFRSKKRLRAVLLWNVTCLFVLPTLVIVAFQGVRLPFILETLFVAFIGGGICLLGLLALQACGYRLSAYGTQAAPDSMIESDLKAAAVDTTQAARQFSIHQLRRIWTACFFAMAVCASAFTVYLDYKRSHDDERLYEVGQRAIETGGHIKVQGRKLYALKVGTGADDQFFSDYGRLDDLEKLSLAGANITDAVVPHLARFEKLNAIDVSGTKVTDAFIEELSKLRRIKYPTELSIADTQISRKSRRKILTELGRNLTHLDVGGLGITDEELAQLPYRTINLGLRDNQITDAGLKTLIEQRGTMMGSLDLSGNPVDGSGFAGQPLAIDTLVLDRTNVSDKTIATHLSAVTMQKLVLRNTQLTDAALPSLLKLTGIAAWELGDGNFTDDGLSQLSSAAPITQLTLCGKQFTGACFKTWRPGLQILSMRGSSVTDKDLAHVANLALLTNLDLSDTAITDEGLKVLEKTSQPIFQLNLSRTKITPEGLKSVRLPLCDAIVIDLNQFSLEQLKSLRAVLPIVTDTDRSEE